MDPHHRKIDLQSPADLTYLHENIRRAARAKLDLAIPLQGEDAFRTKVRELVEEYITSTLSLSLPSLSLNGLPASPSLVSPPTKAGSTTNPTQPESPKETDTNYEPYDARLAQKLRELYAQLERESTRVAELRREAPGAAARAWVERLEGEMREQGELREEGGTGRGQDEKVDLGGEVEEAGRLERESEVRRMWGKGVEGLVGLERVTGVLARLERAGRAAEVVEGS